MIRCFQLNQLRAKTESQSLEGTAQIKLLNTISRTELGGYLATGLRTISQ